MQLTMEIETDNATFENKEEEICRIIRKMAEQIASGSDGEKVFDINGNRVGYWHLI